jgi:hypothetical protein
MSPPHPPSPMARHVIPATEVHPDALSGARVDGSGSTQPLNKRSPHVRGASILPRHESSNFNHPFPHGAYRETQRDLAVESEEDSDEEFVEELFGQLWAVPKPAARAHTVGRKGGCLVWIRKDLVKERRIRPEDSYPVSRDHRFVQPTTTMSFT